MQNPKISLIIPAYNEEKYIGECLKSVIENSDGKFHEIIVVDNGSTDRTTEIARGFSCIKVVHEKLKGTNRARERGLRESTGDLIAFIDADTQLHSNWHDTAQKIFSKNPDMVSLSGPYRYYDGPKPMRYLQNIMW